MYWLDKYKKDFNFETDSVLAKATGINQSSFQTMRKSQIAIRKVKYDNIRALANAAKMDMNSFETYIEKFE